jgi:hypothetical protein
MIRLFGFRLDGAKVDLTEMHREEVWAEAWRLALHYTAMLCGGQATVTRDQLLRLRAILIAKLRSHMRALEEQFVLDMQSQCDLDSCQCDRMLEQVAQSAAKAFCVGNHS